MLTLVIKKIDEDNDEQTTTVTGAKSYTVINLNRELSYWKTCYRVDIVYQDASTSNRKLTDVIKLSAYENGILIDKVESDSKNARFK